MGAKIPREEERTLLIEEHKNLVFKVVHKISKRINYKVEMDDLVSWGFTGLMEAHDRYDESAGTQFSTFAYYRVRGAILDGLGRMRSEQDLRCEQGFNEAFETYAHVVSSSGGRSLEERITGLGSLSSQLGMICVLGQSPEGAFCTDGAPHQQELIERQTYEKLRATLKRLPELEERVLRAYYYDERSLSEIAHELGHSPSWASRIHTRALDRLRGLIEGDRDLEDLRYALPV